MTDELWTHDAITLARLIAAREVSSREVVDAHLARIEQVNPSINALTAVLVDEACEAADAADRAVADGRSIGPLHGVPCTVKQNIDQRGQPTNCGIPALQHAVADADAPVVERMRAAGAIPIARSNCPDMGLRVHTDSALFGLTRNPWNSTRTAGGSSGGEAAALASGMTPIGLGNDIGGSLRNPASCCGIASIKPSAGRVPGFGAVPAPDGSLAFQVMPSEGPMARRVADLRLGLAVLSGHDPRDPHSVPSPGPMSVPDRPRRVAVLADPGSGSTDPRIAARTRAAVAALAARGYELVDLAPPHWDDVVALWAEFLVADLHMLAPLVGPMMSDDARKFLDAGTSLHEPGDLGRYTQVLMARQGLMRDWGLWFRDVDVLVTPAWTQLPFEHGFDVASREGSLATLELIRCVMPGNLLGIPSACVNAGTIDGLPVGVLVNAGRFRDDAALDAAEIIEGELAVSTPITPDFS